MILGWWESRRKCGTVTPQVRAPGQGEENISRVGKGSGG